MSSKCDHVTHSCKETLQALASLHELNTQSNLNILVQQWPELFVCCWRQTVGQLHQREIRSLRRPDAEDLFRELSKAADESEDSAYEVKVKTMLCATQRVHAFSQAIEMNSYRICGQDQRIQKCPVNRDRESKEWSKIYKRLKETIPNRDVGISYHQSYHEGKSLNWLGQC